MTEQTSESTTESTFQATPEAARTATDAPAIADSWLQKPASSGILVRWLFLRCLGVIHLMAFGSFAFQILGLNGSRGILPTVEMLQQLDSSLGWKRYLPCPTLAWFNSSDAFLHGMTIVGVVLSLFVIAGVATAPCLLALAVLWLSLSVGGGEFMGFQSDAMLVELTVVALFYAPWQLFEPPWAVPQRFRRQSPPPQLGLWLIRFMLFRIMFVSGIVKLFSGDTSWQDFTAMQYHFETQPIPTPLAWYAHRLPALLHKVSVAGMFVTELVAPFGMFAPRTFRLIAAALMVSLHFFIALTGNYTFLSYLMIALCLTLLDDQLLSRFVPAKFLAAFHESIDERKPGKLRETVYKSCCALFFSMALFVSSATLLGRSVLTPLRPLVAIFSSLQLTNSYGLFAVMTKARPEIVFEGSNDGKAWFGYEFPCKPGNDLKRDLPWVAPHMPRLDWRLWFAAMAPIEENQWVLALVKRMLEGDTEVTSFFAVNPFPKNPPKYIRAFVYEYHFSDFNEHAKTGAWWRRDKRQSYVPAMMLHGDQLEIAPLGSAD